MTRKQIRSSIFSTQPLWLTLFIFDDLKQVFIQS